MNKYIIGFAAIIIIYYLYWNSIINVEPFADKDKDKTIILLGDSILKNNKYVKDGQSVEDFLRQKMTKVNSVYCFAKDDSIIQDVYKQINRIKIDRSSIIFLSIGGNNILQGGESLSRIFKQYMELVDDIIKKNDCKLILINLYYPTDIKYLKYYPSIQKWNEMLNIYVRDTKTVGQQIQVLDASAILTTPSDFTSEIEPSEIGGRKLANKIAAISI